MKFEQIAEAVESRYGPFAVHVYNKVGRGPDHIPMYEDDISTNAEDQYIPMVARVASLGDKSTLVVKEVLSKAEAMKWWKELMMASLYGIRLAVVTGKEFFSVPVEEPAENLRITAYPLDGRLTAFVIRNF